MTTVVLVISLLLAVSAIAAHFLLMRRHFCQVQRSKDLERAQSEAALRQFKKLASPEEKDEA